MAIKTVKSCTIEELKFFRKRAIELSETIFLKLIDEELEKRGKEFTK